ncbi:MAG: trigger factor [Advenella sp.]|uniref:Trigger factor n=1 Tax=Advenella kashmirensis TaxID=310575 RepID=A0A356LH13_9BURK|nr:trigger factor [Advenella kashmirensis]
MQPTVETLEGLERKVNLVISIDDVEKEVKTQLSRVARTAKVQGFRPGKAPVSVIERSHGPGVRYDVINQKVGQLFDEAIREAKLRVAGAPSIEPTEENATDGQLSFAAKFEVYPEVSVPDLEALEVTRFNAEVGEQEVNNTIDILRKQRATFSADAERAAEKDDRVTVDFVGKIDGVEFEGGKAEDFPFQLGQGRMLPEFEEAASGLKAGESKAFSLTFPEDYPGKEVAGKTAEFTITVKEVAVPVLPEVDSEFAKSLGQPEGDTEKLLSEVRSNIEREVKNRTQARTKNSVMDALAKSASFDVPKSLVDNDVQSRIVAAREDLKQRGMPNADTMDIPADAFKSDSERRVRLGLIVAELVDSAKLQVTPEQVRTRIEEFAQNYEKPEQVVTYYLTDRERRAEIESVVLEDNVVDHILSKAKVTEEKVPFEELMGTV